MIRYVDTSAALKLVVNEAESDAVAADLTASSKRGDHLVASMLLHTEWHARPAAGAWTRRRSARFSTS